jgi:hypothetical protein
VAWQEQIKHTALWYWVFVNESSEATKMARRYGRAPRGE